MKMKEMETSELQAQLKALKTFKNPTDEVVKVMNELEAELKARAIEIAIKKQAAESMKESKKADICCGIKMVKKASAPELVGKYYVQKFDKTQVYYYVYGQLNDMVYVERVYVSDSFVQIKTSSNLTNKFLKLVEEVSEEEYNKAKEQVKERIQKREKELAARCEALMDWNPLTTWGIFPLPYIRW